jgi:hypothetical protein
MRNMGLMLIFLERHKWDNNYFHFDGDLSMIQMMIFLKPKLNIFGLLGDYIGQKSFQKIMITKNAYFGQHVGHVWAIKLQNFFSLMLCTNRCQIQKKNNLVFPGLFRIYFSL